MDGGLNRSGAAFSGWAEHKIHADEVVDSAAAKTVPRPSRGSDDAEAGDRPTFVISNCQDDVTRAQRRRIGGRRRGQSIRLKASGAWIASAIVSELQTQTSAGRLLAETLASSLAARLI